MLSPIHAALLGQLVGPRGQGRAPQQPPRNYSPEPGVSQMLAGQPPLPGLPVPPQPAGHLPMPMPFHPPFQPPEMVPPAGRPAPPSLGSGGPDDPGQQLPLPQPSRTLGRLPTFRPPSVRVPGQPNTGGGGGGGHQLLRRY